MTTTDRANAVIGTIGMMMAEVYREARDFADQMVREAVADEVALWKEAVAIGGLEANRVEELVDSLRKQRENG